MCVFRHQRGFFAVPRGPAGRGSQGVVRIRKDDSMELDLGDVLGGELKVQREKTQKQKQQRIVAQREAEREVEREAARLVMQEHADMEARLRELGIADGTIKRAQRELVSAQYRAMRGEDLGDETLKRVKSAALQVSRAARPAVHTEDDTANLGLTVQRVARRRQRVSENFENVHNVQDFVPGWGGKASKGFPSEALDRYSFASGDTYLLSYLIQDYPAVFRGRVYVLPMTLTLDVRKMYFTGAGRPQVDPTTVRLPPTDRPLLIPVRLTIPLLALHTPSPSMAHANFLYVDHARQMIEIFEPHGDAIWAPDVEKRVQHVFRVLLPSYSVQSLGALCPLGPQVIAKKYDTGFCVTHANYYAVLRVLNPKVPPERIIKYMTRGGAEAVQARIDKVAAYVGRRLGELRL